MKKLYYILFFSLLLTAPNLRSQVSSDVKKDALLEYLKNDPSTSPKYNDILSMLNKGNNFHDVYSCSESAMNYLVASSLLKSVSLSDFITNMQEKFDDHAFNQIMQQYFNDLKYWNESFQKYLEMFSYYPPYTDIKSMVDFYILSVSSGQDRYDVYDNMLVMYGKEIEMIENAKKKIPKDIYLILPPVYYLTYLYHTDYLKQAKLKMEETKKFSENDMVFCVRKILKMLDENEEKTSKEKTFTGTWKSGWGLMTLVQSGQSVTGTYDFRNGKISGTVYTNSNGLLEFKGTWSQDNTNPPTGEIIMTLLVDGTIDGKYTFTEKNVWLEDWDQVRVK